MVLAAKRMHIVHMRFCRQQNCCRSVMCFKALTREPAPSIVRGTQGAALPLPSKSPPFRNTLVQLARTTSLHLRNGRFSTWWWRWLSNLRAPRGYFSALFLHDVFGSLWILVAPLFTPIVVRCREENECRDDIVFMLFFMSRSPLWWSLICPGIHNTLSPSKFRKIF